MTVATVQPASGGVLEIPTPRWALPFLKPMRYKGLRGGRGSGKSHFFAELAVETMLLDPYTNIVCLREIQQSLKFSSKKVIEKKIYTMGVGSSFRVLDNEIRRIGRNGHSTGIMIFQGMKDHTADTIKSLEGFNRAWFEEASRASARSLELLRPTIREPGSELWFSWNPDQETDPIEKLLVVNPRKRSIVAHINFQDNVFCPDEIKKEAAEWRRTDPDSYDHVWLGGYNTKSDDQILAGKWREADFEIDPAWDGPYYGADWGFSTDPTVVIECYIDSAANTLYVSREIWGLHIETVELPEFFSRMTGCENYTIRGDNARPETISHMMRHGYPRMKATEKWDGSIMDGISHLRSYAEIVIRPTCPHMLEECRMYKYKRDRLTGDVLPDIIDKWNHCADSLRYSLEPMTKRKPKSFWDGI